MTTFRNLQDFLVSHNAKNANKQYTHTRIGDKDSHIFGGSYYIAPEELDTFNTLYCQTVFREKKVEYLTEKQYGYCIAIDLDFRYSSEVTTRQHEVADIAIIVEQYLKELPKLVAYDGRPLDVFVFEKPTVNRLEEVTKDGIHIILGVKMDFKTQLKLREKMLTTLPKMLELPITNTWETVLDESISRGSTNWQLFGSRKPGNEAYQLTHHWMCQVDHRDGNMMCDEVSVPEDIAELFQKLSVQYQGHPEFELIAKPTAPVLKTATATNASQRTGAKEKNPETVGQLVDAILETDATYFDEYDMWSRLGFIIFNTFDGSKQGADLFYALSQNFQTDSGKKHDENSVMKQYYNAQPNREKKLSIDTLYAWLAKVNPEHPLSKKSQMFKFATDDDQASDIIYNELKDVFKSYKGRLFYHYGNIWVADRALIDDHVLHYIMKSNIYLGMNEKTNKPIAFTQNVTKARKVQDALYSKIRVLNDDEALYEKFHSTTRGKLVFEDGVLDLQAKTFTLWTDIPSGTIFATTKINYSYAEFFQNPDMEAVNDVKQKIFDVAYGDKTETALKFLARAIGGNYGDKRWASYMGNRNSGKGVEYDLLANAFGSYVSAFELGNLMYCRKTTGTDSIDSKKMYWLMDLEFVRLAISQEVPDSSTGLKVNGTLFKKLAGGGDTIVARRNFDRFDTHFTLDTTFYIKGNNTLECDGADCDETRLEFESVTQFKTKDEIDAMTKEVGEGKRLEEEMRRYHVADPTIKDKCKTDNWKMATVHLLMTYYLPTAVEIKRKVDTEVNTLIGALRDRFVFTYVESDKLLCSDVYALMKEFDRGKVKLELSQFNIHSKKEKGRGEYRDKLCFLGIKQRLDETELSETSSA